MVYGAGGHGREVAALVGDLQALAEAPDWEVLGFVDDDPRFQGEVVSGLKVCGSMDWLIAQEPKPAVAIGLGAPHVKRRISSKLRDYGFEFPTLIHPSAQIGPRVTIGEGTVVAAGAILTTDIPIASFVTINLGCTISHDTMIEDFVTIAPGAHIAGNAFIAEGAEIGIGAAAIQGVRVGRWSILGAGAVAVRDIPDNAVAVGIPARPKKQRSDGWHED